MPHTILKPGEFRVSDLSQTRPTRFEISPDAQERSALARHLGVSAIKKLHFSGSLAPAGAEGWHLTGTLGATVVQPCVATLEPVTTRIDEPVERRFVPQAIFDSAEPGSETEMPEDTSLEPLGAVISAHEAMIESLMLALPPYPRSDAAEPADARFAQEGVTPLTDADVKPFAGLAALRDKMKDGS